jgi:rfaE bifunctional protein nucleotidyltransferase chain/domain
MKKKSIQISDLEKIRKQFYDKKIVLCHGVFDIFHHGHLEHLRSAKKYGEILVVTITPDKFVNKGPDRPRFDAARRADILTALDIIDFVAINDQATSINVINSLKPNFYIKGNDYRNLKGDITGGIVDEKKAVEEHDGKLIFTSDPLESSSELINAFFTLWSDDQKDIIQYVKNEIGISRVLELIDSLKSLNVLVVGEPIIDTYVFCNPENLSSKSPSISANFIREENYAGGSLAVASHLSALGCVVNLIAPSGNEQFSLECFSDLRQISKINILDCFFDSLPTPRKTRFITEFMKQRMFEITNLDAERWAKSNLDKFHEMYNSISNNVDIIVALDFGHGLWENDRINLFNNSKVYKSLNVQTNSGNYGYNFFTKYKSFDYLAIDERELRLTMKDRFSDISGLAQIAFAKKIQKSFCLTLGARGSMFVSQRGDIYKCPIFSKDPIDTTGAGDAFFAITSLLTKLGADELLILFLGNIYAGMKTRILGNKEPVNKVAFVKAVSTILK